MFQLPQEFTRGLIALGQALEFPPEIKEKLARVARTLNERGLLGPASLALLRRLDKALDRGGREIDKWSLTEAEKLAYSLLGLKPEEFWELTPAELEKLAEGRLLRERYEEWRTRTVAPQRDTEGKPGEANAPDEQTATAKANLPPSRLRAWSLYMQAVAEEPELQRKTDRETHDWITDNLLDKGESIPPFATWRRYLSEARAAFNQRKHEPRSGRTGRSIVRRDQID